MTRRTSLAVVLALALAGSSGAVALGHGNECHPDADGEIGVMVLVDFGDLDPERDPEATCVSVPRGSTGLDALAARGAALGRPALRFDDSGLLCAIDGLPERGCGEVTDGGFRYWAYWLGEVGEWRHSDAGPGFRDAKPLVVEGWRFTDGAGGPEDSPPSVSPGDVAAPAPSSIEADGGSDGGDVPWGLIVGAGLVGAVIVTGFLVRRRREQA